MLKKNSKVIKLMIEIMAYSSAAVFGPLAVFLGTGFWLDKKFGSYPKFLLINLAISFVVTNILLIKKSKSISQSSFSLVKKINQEGKKDDRSGSKEEKNKEVKKD